MKVKILGTVQDGGVPHLGCSCDVCQKAREDNETEFYGSSLLLKADHSDDSVRYLIDATPDIRHQITGEFLDGVFLPHTDLGHVTGLLYFGEEGNDASGLKVYGDKDVREYLMHNDPYRLLIDRGNIDVKDFKSEEFNILGGRIDGIRLPHAHITGKTTSYMIEGQEKKLYYVPDVSKINDKAAEQIREADVAIIDGTFYSQDEIDRYEEVPHPTIKKSMDRFEDTDTEIYFTHLNHTNPVLREDSEERQKVENRGFNIAEQEKTFDI